MEAELHPVGEGGAPADLQAGDDHVGPVPRPHLHCSVLNGEKTRPKCHMVAKERLLKALIGFT